MSKEPLTSEEQLVAFAMAFVVFAGRAIRGAVDRAGTARAAVACGVEFVTETKRAGVLPSKETLR